MDINDFDLDIESMINDITALDDLRPPMKREEGENGSVTFTSLNQGTTNDMDQKLQMIEDLRTTLNEHLDFARDNLDITLAITFCAAFHGVDADEHGALIPGGNAEALLSGGIGSPLQQVAISQAGAAQLEQKLLSPQTLLDMLKNMLEPEADE